MEVLISKCAHSHALSPVQMAPYFCEPAKKDLDNTKGRICLAMYLTFHDGEMEEHAEYIVPLLVLITGQIL